MWNYTFLIPGMLILAIILFFYFDQRRLPVRRNRIFLTLLVLDVATMVCDYISTIADEYHTGMSIPVLYLLNTLFFVVFLARIFWFFLFFADVMHLNVFGNARRVAAFCGVFAVSEILALTSFLTGAVFSIDEAGYHSGPLYNVLYVSFFFYIIVSIVVTVMNRSHQSAFSVNVLLGYNAVLLVGNIARLIFPRVLIMDMFCVLAILVIFLGFENPDLYIYGRGHAFNVRAFNDYLDDLRNWRRANILGIVLINYNDQRGIYGGVQMDRGIYMIAEYLSETFPNYTLFYLSGGCFAFVGPESLDYDTVIGTVRRRFLEPWDAENTELYLEPTFVRADYSPVKLRPERFIDTFLIALDSAGRAEWQNGGDSFIQKIDRQLDVKRSLERALDENGVEVFLQPLVDSATGELIAAEALARIRDAEGNIICPGEFIPLAEKSGHISILGEQVFEKTCAFINEYGVDRFGIRWINVNLSPIQCMRVDLPAVFGAILDRYGVPAGLIHLEITEESMVDFAVAEKQLLALQERGFQLVLDDYGSGYSNLSRLMKVNFTNIKLDMGVVRSHFEQSDAILPSLVDIFRRSGRTVTAEGIETPEMAKRFAELGCDYLQGYNFSKPIPIDEFVKKYGRK